MKQHKHKAIPSQERTVGWTHCVAGGSCSGASHGGVTFVDYCACGAERKTECNGRHSARGAWIEPEPRR